MFRALVRRVRGLLALAVFAAASACSGRAASAQGRAPEPVPAARLVPAPAARPVPAAALHDTVARNRAVRFRFDAGSAVFGPPAVGTDGTLYIGTADGRVQAIDPEGVLVWSYTVEGAVASSPRFDAQGRNDARLFVATTAARLCSFSPTGTLGWMAHTPVHVVTPLATSSAWGVLFGGADGSVWAFLRHGVASWHVDLGAAITAGPDVAASSAPGAGGGRIVVGTSEGDVVLLDGARKRHVAHLGAAVRSVPAVFADGSSAVIAGSALYRLGARGEILRRREEVAYASFATSGSAVVLDTKGALVRLTSEGDERARLALGRAPSDAPVVAPTGTVYVPTEAGVLVAVESDGAVTEIPVAHGSLQRVVLDEPRRRAIVTGGSGVVVALEVP